MSIFPRSSGVLLHPTSLPGGYGIGDLGDYAYRFVDMLQTAGQSLWQMLPLGPTSYGDSPYQCLSAFAGNPNLISLDRLEQLGWLSTADLAQAPRFPDHQVDYGPVIAFHNQMLEKAYQNFKKVANEGYRQAFGAWCKREAAWLDDYALFFALKQEFDGRPWTEWDTPLALRDAQAIADAQKRLASTIESVKFCQWLFFGQWEELKSYANARGIRIVGDIPIFVAHDSSDVWANPHHYSLDAQGKPTVVAGVPPDYFSATGQRWGNPLYRWDVHKAEGYTWWIARVKAALSMSDIIRIDHFRAFEDYWEIPGSEETAIKGRWLKGPNLDLFRAIQAALGADLPIIAEDLGQITPAVEKLRDDLRLPGMKIIQFGFSDPNNVFLPHNYTHDNFVVYTGTHDNNTAVGWWQGEASAGEREYCIAYFNKDISHSPHWEMIRLAMSSTAHTCIIPMQDVLGLGADCRMNTPGKLGGNWSWRITPAQFGNQDAFRTLAHFTRVYARWPGKRHMTRG
jgi:4-alpha-glucanotransferase